MSAVFVKEPMTHGIPSRPSGFDSTNPKCLAGKMELRWGAANSKHKKGELVLPFRTTDPALVVIMPPTTGTNQRIVIGVVGIITRTTLRLYSVEEVT